MRAGKAGPCRLATLEPNSNRMHKSVQCCVTYVSTFFAASPEFLGGAGFEDSALSQVCPGAALYCNALAAMSCKESDQVPCARMWRTLVLHLVASGVSDVESVEACCRSIGLVHASTLCRKGSECTLTVTFVDSRDCSQAAQALSSLPLVAEVAPIHSKDPAHILYSAVFASMSQLCCHLFRTVRARTHGLAPVLESCFATRGSLPSTASLLLGTDTNVVYSACVRAVALCLLSDLSLIHI